jgi:hypothetical protein
MGGVRAHIADSLPSIKSLYGEIDTLAVRLWFRITFPFHGIGGGIRQIDFG